MTVTSQRIQYVSRNLQTGLTDVKIDIYNQAGTKVVNQAALSELGGGLYYYDYTPAAAGWHQWVADSISQPRVATGTFLSDYTTSASSSSTGSGYATTLQLARFLDIEETIPSRSPGATHSKETVGTGDNSTATFYLDHAYLIDDTYTFYYGATEAAASALTETTHYTIDLDTGLLTLTAAGITLVSTNNIYASYSYCEVEVTNTQLSNAITRAESEIDGYTNNHWADGTATTPDWEIISNEVHDGRGKFFREYYTLHYPLPDVNTALNGAVSIGASTITVDSTAGFPTAGTIGIGTDKITYTGKTSTTFTGCAGVASAHSDNDTVLAFVLEISSSDIGSTPTWEVQEHGTDYHMDLKSGRFQLQDPSMVASNFVQNGPIKDVANRVRITYLFGSDEITGEITNLTLMMAAKNLLHTVFRKAVLKGTKDFRIENLGIDDKWIEEALDENRNNFYSNV